MLLLILDWLENFFWFVVGGLCNNLFCYFELKIIFICFSVNPINFGRFIILGGCEVKICYILFRFLLFDRYFLIMFWSIWCILFVAWSLFGGFWPISFLKLTIRVQISVSELYFSFNLRHIIIIQFCVLILNKSISTFKIRNTFFLKIWFIV
jgi:hypothetical protein